jgi:[calcium/calmodulin-dependent protein kinase] kinase
VRDALQDVLGEIVLMKKLNHPNVVHLYLSTYKYFYHLLNRYEVLDDPNENKLVLVMEYMEKGPVMTLEEGKAAQPIPPNLAWRLFRDMIKGLDYCNHF